MFKTPSFRLDGKRALVVGASSGIGQACAVALGEYGAEVILAARRKAQLGDTKEMITQLGVQSQVVLMDASDCLESQNLIKEHGPFDILLNAAGMARHSYALETHEDDFDAVVELNFKGAYFLSQAVARGLIDAGKRGSLIHISSQMAHIGGVERSVYAGSKHALEGMIKSMAIEWGGYGIRINSIAPTFIKTALTASTFDNPERMAWIHEKIKLERVGEPEDIMGAAVFLASDASALITGTSLLIDGGWTAG